MQQQRKQMKIPHKTCTDELIYDHKFTDNNNVK